MVGVNPVVHGCTYGETQRSTVPFVSWFPSHTLQTMQSRFTLGKNEGTREAGRHDTVALLRVILPVQRQLFQHQAVNLFVLDQLTL